MSQLGQLLRETRIRQKISLEELQELTKIRKGYLEAIEEGNYRILPGSFYVKAFIRAYSEAVGIDPAEALKMYTIEAAPETVQETPPEATISTRRRNTRNTEKWSRIASTVLVISFVVLIIAIIYYFAFNNSSRNPDASTDTNKITDKSSSLTPTPVPTTKLSPTPVPTPTPTPELAEVKLTGKEGNIEVYEVSHSDKLKISIEIVDARCWLSVHSLDQNNRKTSVYSGEMKNGDTETWELDASAQIRLGAASAVKLKVNDTEIPVGDQLNVKDFKFVLQQP